MDVQQTLIDSMDETFQGYLRDVVPIGEGGFGQVFGAFHVPLGRKVAIKVLSERQVDNPSTAIRFQRESQALCRIQHPNVVSVHSCGTLKDGRPYFIMEYLEGKTLDAVRQSDVLTLNEIENYVDDLLSGLGAIHAVGLVHRDLKPSNCMVVSSPGSKRKTIKIFDFGLVKNLDSQIYDEQQLTAPGSTCGTSAYMSPEQCRGGPVDERSDIYALGCILYFMVTGQPPFIDPVDLNVRYHHVHHEPEPINKKMGILDESGNNLVLQKVIDTALQKCVSARYHLLSSIPMILRGYEPLQ